MNDVWDIHLIKLSHYTSSRLWLLPFARYYWLISALTALRIYLLLLRFCYKIWLKVAYRWVVPSQALQLNFWAPLRTVNSSVESRNILYDDYNMQVTVRVETLVKLAKQNSLKKKIAKTVLYVNYLGDILTSGYLKKKGDFCNGSFI